MSAAILSLLLADSRTPAGGYAHSGGLEAAVEAGLGAAEVRAFVAARLETVALADAAFAAAACRAASCTRAGKPSASAAGLAAVHDRIEGDADGRGDGARRRFDRDAYERGMPPSPAALRDRGQDSAEHDANERSAPPSPATSPTRAGTCADEAAVSGTLPALFALDDELAARTPSPPLRAAARQLGRALLRVAARLWPGDPLLAAYGDTSEWTPRPVVLGVVAARAGLAPADAARLSLYEDAAGVAAAAVKLLPLDAADATAWVAELAPRIDALARKAAAPPAPAPPAPAPLGSTPPAPAPLGLTDLPAAATPLLDLRSLDHDQSLGRLFVT